MMIILFLALSLIPASLAQPESLHQYEARSCGLTLVHENLPDNWFEPDEAAPQDEASARIMKRLSGGVNHLTAPWIVQVVITTVNIPGYFYVCTGSLISRWWVISAAHCFYYRNELTLNYEWIEQNEIEIKAGPWNMTATGFPWRRRSQNYFVPDEFKQRVNRYNLENTKIGRVYDIALVLLDQPLNPIHQPTANQFLVNYICLPSGPPDFNKQYRIAGFGSLVLPARNMDFGLLKDYRSKIRNSTACRFANYNATFTWLRREFRNPEYTMTQEMIDLLPWKGDPQTVCTTMFEHNEYTTCEGDSGGPLSVQRSQPDDQGHVRWELTGIVEGNMRADRNFFIDLLTQFRLFGGLPGVTREGIAQRANIIMPRYENRWPCGHESHFNLVIAYQDWLLYIIKTHSPGDPTISWLYYATFVGFSFGAVLHGTIKRSKTPALEADPEQAPATGQAPVPGQDVEVGQQKH